MGEKVFLGLLLVLFDCCIKDALEIGGSGRSGRYFRHGDSSEEGGMTLVEQKR